MNRFATPLLLAALALSATPALAQPDTPPGPAADDNVVFFVDGSNLDLSAFEGTVVDTVGYTGQTDTVAKFPFGPNESYALRFDTGTGVDLSDNVEDGDVLHFWIYGTPTLQNSQTRFAGDYSGVQIRLLDSFESTNEADLGDPSAKDLGFRLTFAVPNSLLNGTWQEVELAFPPATRAELDANRAQYAADGDLRQYLYYEGAEVFNSQGVGPAFNEGDPDTDFQEFDFENVVGLYVAYEFEQIGGAPAQGAIYLDDVYIGDRDLDLDFARARPSALSGASATASGGTVTFSIPANDDYARYRIYASESPITLSSFDGQDVFSLNDQLIYPVATVDADDVEDGTVTFEQEVFRPYPTFGNTELYFAVVGDSRFGVANNDVGSGTTGSVTVAGDPQGFIFEVDTPTADAILDAVDAGTVTLDPWTSALSAPGTNDPAFTLGTDRSKLTGGTGVEGGNDDLSVPQMYVAYDAAGFFYVYAEVVDDNVVVADTSVSNDLYQFDSIETYLGLYAVDSPFFGQDDQTQIRGLGRGDTPDYQIKYSPRVDVNGDPAGVFIDALTIEGFNFTNIKGGQLPGARGAWERTDDGYRFMAYFELVNLINFPNNQPDTPDPDLLPTGDDVKLIPFNFTVNENDDPTGNRNRSAQLSWSVRYNTDGDLFRVGSQWTPTAIVASGALMATDGEDGPGGVAAFSLGALSPNPTRSGAEIALTLAVPSEVTVEVYDMLGRRVMQPHVRVPLSAGAHGLPVRLDGLAPGVYVVSVQAGAERSTGKLTVVR